MSLGPENGKAGSLASDLPVDVAALVAEAALPLAQLLLRRRLRLQKALHRLHLPHSDLALPACLGAWAAAAPRGADAVAAILLQAKRSKDRTGQGNGTSCDGFFFFFEEQESLEHWLG
jgi:hypothetical protein